MPRPYLMCSEEECRERQEMMEVSEFEATEETFTKSPKFRSLDPRLAVAKYRRSAAGTKQRRPRRLPALMESWKHLCEIVVHQKLHPQQSPKSLANTVAFVDDRIRAIQVDLVVSQQVSGDLQIQLVRYQLVMLYLLSNVPRQTYEPKFARQALMTALVAYWNDDRAAHDDEILAYTALCRVAASLVEDGGAWVEGDEVLATYRHHAKPNASYPKFAYALQIASAAHLEEYYIVLKLLFGSDDDSSFVQLCRMCLAPALNRLRWLSLSHYNKAFMKREKLPPAEVARLLFLPSEDAAIEFCCTKAGLPHEDGRVLFKAAPLKELSSYSIERANDDDCIFNLGEDYRTDENKVQIPSSEVMKRLILQHTS